MLTRADQTTFPYGNTYFPCPDQQLSSKLRTAANQIDKIPEFPVSKIVVNEGPVAVVEAMTRLRTTTIGLVKCAAVFFTRCELPASADVLRVREERRSGSVALSEQRPGLGNDDAIPLTLPIMVDAIIAGLAFYRYRKENIIANPQQFVELINQIFFRSFGRMPFGDESITPIRAVIVDRWNSHYAAVPLDFAGYNSSRIFGARIHNPAQKLPIHDRLSEAQLAQSNYIDHVFTAFHDAGLVKFLGFLGKLTNFFGPKMARQLLKRQNSPFAQAASFRIYKFYPDAWRRILTHMLWTEPSVTGRQPGAAGLPPPIGLGTPDRFPDGFTHDTQF